MKIEWENESALLNTLINKLFFLVKINLKSTEKVIIKLYKYILLWSTNLIRMFVYKQKQFFACIKSFEFLSNDQQFCCFYKIKNCLFLRSFLWKSLQCQIIQSFTTGRIFGKFEIGGKRKRRICAKGSTRFRLNPSTSSLHEFDQHQTAFSSWPTRRCKSP